MKNQIVPQNVADKLQIEKIQEPKSKRKLLRKEKAEFLSIYLDPKNCLGLEIGPNISPLFPKKEEFKVEYIESKSTEELKERCIAAGTDVDRVEHIDYVFQRDKGLIGSVDKENYYDYVISSHVIEHIPDLVTHFHEVSQILNPSGLFGLIVPDKTLCFDFSKPHSTIGQILQAYIEKRTKPPIASYIDEIRYGAMLKKTGKGAWSIDDLGNVRQKYLKRYDKLNEIVLDANKSDSWFGHTWFFTCDSFLSIINDLQLMNLIDFELIDIHPTGHMDFIVILGKKESKSSKITYEEALSRIEKTGYFNTQKVKVMNTIKPLSIS